eukprot:CAMPEP_0182445548 /NCGR_PEP_ID=MMETSP1172-20130603/3635_1 /TAXON_ID=708627 /ORGANISM="Timspurckia oligopyrenoides, Strain CCMP3278" /LENGTH=322 /DNA_ID=CAMNT_0024641343 /DNA_START=567 /DNA_END=1535 /DNA_ORIENTATION=+
MKINSVFHESHCDLILRTKPTQNEDQATQVVFSNQMKVNQDQRRIEIPFESTKLVHFHDKILPKYTLSIILSMLMDFESFQYSSKLKVQLETEYKSLLSVRNRRESKLKSTWIILDAEGYAELNLICENLQSQMYKSVLPDELLQNPLKLEELVVLAMEFVIDSEPWRELFWNRDSRTALKDELKSSAGFESGEQTRITAQILEEAWKTSLCLNQELLRNAGNRNSDGCLESTREIDEAWKCNALRNGEPFDGNASWMMSEEEHMKQASDALLQIEKCLEIDQMKDSSSSSRSDSLSSSSSASFEEPDWNQVLSIARQGMGS